MTIDHLLINKSAGDAERIVHAFEFARKAHQDQKRLSGEPYIIHPIAVASILNELSLDTATLVAALLHDTLEDTNATEIQIREQFGDDVTFLVQAVTKIKDLEDRDTPETSYRTLMKMFFAMADDIRVILIKLADCLHNLRTLHYMPTDRQAAHALKSIEIYAPIAERLNMGEMKGEIEDLAFPYAFPAQYQELTATATQYYTERKHYTDAIRPMIMQYLQENGTQDFKIDSRVKHYYSLYQKLRRHNNDINVIYDLVAFRIIVPDVASCYQVLGTIHQKYKPLPTRIKDYIALPKPNGYQSLHSTVFCEEGRLVEFQIRTPEMHEHAEKGIASHWAYDESGKSTKTRANKIELAWVNKIREWRNYIDNPQEFFDTLKLDMFKHRIFVFTPKGDIKDLPEGATPLDFAYAVHSDIGDHCTGAKANGKMVSLKYPLQNGDVCYILTAKNQKPNRDWLECAQTPEARRRIRSFLKRTQ